jgi:HSP20 family protein
MSSTWREMDRLRREMDRLFSSMNAGLDVAPCYPAVNAWTSEEGILVSAELPGVRAEEIEVSVVNDTLTLSGSRPVEDPVEGARYHRRERGCGSFSRSFQLPFPVDASRVEADYQDGVLHVSLPRAEADKPKRIEIKTA